MAADSRVRRAAKRVLAPVLGERGYRYIQAGSMARDIRSGALSEPELELIPHVVRPGDTVIDIGANYGMWVYPLSRAVGDDGRVWAFEPIPFTAETLRVIVRLLRLSNVEIIDKGCAERSGVAVFEVPLQHSGAIGAGQAHAAERNDDRPERARHVRWPASRLLECELVEVDELLPTVSHLSLIKADIEGAELLALRGAQSLIEEHHPTIVCEINPWFLEGFGLAVSDLVGFLAAEGYELYRYEQGRLRRVTDPNEVEEDNYVFVHDDRKSSFAQLLVGS